MAVAAIGLASAGATFGTSYDEARSAVEVETLPVLLFLMKFVATLVSML